MPKVKVFAYKDVLGVLAEEPIEGLLNNPKAQGQLGTVVRSDCVEITPDAVDMFRSCTREGGSFAPFMLTKHSEKIIEKSGKSSFGFLGFGKVSSKKHDITISRDCDLCVLDNMILSPNMEIPEDFKSFVDKKK